MNRSRGFTLVEVSVSTVIVGIIILGAIAYIGFQVHAMTNLRTKATGTTIKLNFLNILQNDLAWNNTVKDDANINGSFACLYSTLGCAGSQGPFRILEAAPLASPQVFYDPVTSPNTGFTEAGSPCVNFDAVNGNDICPFQVQMSWTPLCTLGCSPKLIQLNGTLLYKPKVITSVNSTKWSFQLLKAVSIYSSCAEILAAGASVGNGVYLISPGNILPFKAFCDMTSNGGGWTLVSVGQIQLPAANGPVDAPAAESITDPGNIATVATLTNIKGQAILNSSSEKLGRMETDLGENWFYKETAPDYWFLWNTPNGQVSGGYMGTFLSYKTGSTAFCAGTYPDLAINNWFTLSSSWACYFTNSGSPIANWAGAGNPGCGTPSGGGLMANGKMWASGYGCFFNGIVIRRWLR